MQQLGKYDILVKIAEGGMGAVYKGRHRETGELVAIKVVPANTARNPVLLQRFEQEFHAARLLDHPNIVRAIEYSPGPPSPFLVMEFVDGESLGQKIAREGALSEDAAIRILAQVCQGLHRAHKQGLIHRDVKPDNILVTRDGVAKLTDLGLVKDMNEELNLTRTGRGLGTPHFMAPEQFRNAKNANIRCDIYSLGATLYMMVTGEVPFGHKVGPLDCWMKKIRNEFAAPRDLNPKLMERTDWAIRRAMSGDAAMRPASCREFIEDLTGHSIRGVPAKPVATAASGVLWYLVYADETGETHTVKGTLDGIRRALREGLLGDADNIRAAQTKQGPFQPLKTYPELRDLVLDPTAAVATMTPTVAVAAPAARSATGPGSPRWTNDPPPKHDSAEIDLSDRKPNAASASRESSRSRPSQISRSIQRPVAAKLDWKIVALVAMVAILSVTVLALLLTRSK